MPCLKVLTTCTRAWYGDAGGLIGRFAHPSFDVKIKQQDSPCHAFVRQCRSIVSVAAGDALAETRPAIPGSPESMVKAALSLISDGGDPFLSTPTRAWSRVDPLKPVLNPKGAPNIVPKSQRTRRVGSCSFFTPGEGTRPVVICMSLIPDQSTRPFDAR